MTRRRFVLHGLIVAGSLGYFFVAGTANFLLDLLVLITFLNSLLLTLAVLAWTRPGSGQASLHQTLLREEEEWRQARQAARREQP
ncbi:MAG TPA: hypothetical protein VJY40_06890 [Corynebacterium sp.]|jgi:hypothetical protein|nr:hypothetical protein [Corynebacterium sp.]